MLGGGTFITKNKVLPGTYINFVSAKKAISVLSERGIAAFPVVLDWGPEGDIISVESESFKELSLELFGYEYTDSKMLPFREVFKNASKLLCYRLNTGTDKASNTLAEALYGGVRGNDLKIVVRKNVDDNAKYDVETVFGTKIVDKQIVDNASGLKANAYVVFKTNAALEETAGMPLTGGGNGAEELGEAYQKFLDKIQMHEFHVLGCPVHDTSVKSLFMAFTKRMREEMGLKFQTVLYRATDADYEGVISVENKVTDEAEQSLVYWVTGALAGCAVNRSVTNKVYDGECQVDIEYTQRQLADGVSAGKFMLHKVGNDVRVLTDINTLVTFSDTKNEELKNNQTVRVMDQIGNDIAAIFNTRYLGVVSNDQSGRIGLWDNMVSYFKELEKLQAIEAVDAKDIVVSAGDTKKSVVVSAPVTPINCMEQLYMTVIVQ